MHVHRVLFMRLRQQPFICRFGKLMDDYFCCLVGKFIGKFIYGLVLFFLVAIFHIVVALCAFAIIATGGVEDQGSAQARVYGI